MIDFAPRADWKTMKWVGEGKKPSFPWRYLFAPTQPTLFDTFQCVAHGCTNDRRGRSRFCSTCISRKARIANPSTYYFHLLKQSAKKRDIEFNLTKTEFDKFCHETGYLQKVGVKKGGITIDRIDSSRGYEVANIQPMTVSENTAKENRRRAEEAAKEESELF